MSDGLVTVRRARPANSAGERAWRLALVKELRSACRTAADLVEAFAGVLYPEADSEAGREIRQHVGDTKGQLRVLTQSWSIWVRTPRTASRTRTQHCYGKWRRSPPISFWTRTRSNAAPARPHPHPTPLPQVARNGRAGAQKRPAGDCRSAQCRSSRGGFPNASSRSRRRVTRAKTTSGRS
jgi:hypothetical protein